MIRIGLLGASRIARGAVLAPAREIEGVEVIRVAARSAERAGEYAAEHGIDAVSPDYEALVSASDVDLVYNGLPPSEHERWSIRALEAGKHVLCEKPFAMHAGQAENMAAAARSSGRVLMEAFHYRFHPLFARILEVIESGQLGAVRELEAHFNVPVPFTDTELRYRPELGGGAMMDLGCYPLHWARTVMGSEPTVLRASARQHESGVDVAMQADLEFAGDVRASISCAMNEDLPDGLDDELCVVCQRGTLVVDNPLAPHRGHSLTIETAGARDAEKVSGRSTYFHQLEHMLAVIRGEAEPILGPADAIANMRALESIYACAGMPLPARLDT